MCLSVGSLLGFTGGALALYSQRRVICGAWCVCLSAACDGERRGELGLPPAWSYLCQTVRQWRRAGVRSRGSYAASCCMLGARCILLHFVAFCCILLHFVAFCGMSQHRHQGLRATNRLYQLCDSAVELRGCRRLRHLLAHTASHQAGLPLRCKRDHGTPPPQSRAFKRSLLTFALILALTCRRTAFCSVLRSTERDGR